MAQGLARETDTGLVYRKDMLPTLARREVVEAGKKLAQERGMPFRIAENGERISGTYRQPVQLVSGRYALVERSYEFTLVPWRPVIEKQLGQQVTALVRGDGVSWEFGRHARARHRHVAKPPQIGIALPLVLAGQRAGPRRPVKAGASRHRA
jgi:hypothetical protein